MFFKFLSLFTLIAFAIASPVLSQTPSPAEAPAASPSPAKHRSHKKASKETPAPATEASPAAAAASAPAESPSPAKHRARKKAAATETTAASPAPAEAPAASPSPEKRRTRKKPMPETTPTPPPPVTTATPVATPTPRASGFGSFFTKKPVTPASTPTMAGTAPVTTAPVVSSGAKTAPVVAPAPGGGNGMVWVNTKTHIYHRQGSRFYGKTKEGKYMSEQEAISEGDRAAAKGQ